mgnify:CR=1 FL=1
MAKVKRSTQGVRRSAAARNRTQKTHAAKKHTVGLFDQMLALLPFTDEQLHKAFVATILALALAAAWFVASLAGLPALATSADGSEKVMPGRIWLASGRVIVRDADARSLILSATS